MDCEQRDLLLSVSYTYLACGLDRRALPMLLLLAASCKDDPAVLRGLAHAYVAVDRGADALQVLDTLEACDPGGPAPGLLLLRSRALHQQERFDEARACFRTFVACRPSPAASSLEA